MHHFLVSVKLPYKEENFLQAEEDLRFGNAGRSGRSTGIFRENDRRSDRRRLSQRRRLVVSSPYSIVIPEPTRARKRKRFRRASVGIRNPESLRGKAVPGFRITDFRKPNPIPASARTWI